MKKRILSFLLCLTLVLGMLPVISPTPVQATTANQYNIVARADYLYNITWLCQKTVYGWCGNYTFYSGSTYRLPYGQPINAGAYIGYGVSVDTFISAAKDASSVLYTSRSTYGTTNSVYYATDCSAFVSWCWGIDRKTTYSIPLTSNVTYIGMATAANASLLQLGDCLNSNDVGHVVLVTDLTYDSSGNLTQIEITEQTPPQLKRSYYTPSQLGSYYGGYYGIYRYSGTVPSAPNAITTEYYPACDSSYTSLYPALESIGVYCDWTLHCEIAELNGISNFSGTVEQNTQLLDLLKAGKLKNPNYTPIVYYPACDSSYTSLYPAFESLGISTDWDLHCRIAAANGITNFTGTVEQNTQLLDLLKAGKLINPDGTTSGGSSSGGTGNFANGYENGYTGGMAGDGKIYAHGLDVSQWQGSSLSFTSIKNAGYDYVILRAGTSYGKDTCFETYYKNARAAGLDIGAYYYTYATSVSAAQTDANNMLSWISGKTFEYPIYFDYEDSCQNGLSTTTAKNICLTFCDAMAEAGYLTGVYTGYYKSTQLPMSSICAKYEVWIANYWDYGYTTLSPEYSKKYGMYQYTDRNYIGSNGPYDGDVAFKDYPAIVKQYGFNGYAAANPESYLDKCTMYPSHCKVTTTKSTPLNTLPCSTEASYGSQTVVQAEAGQTYTANALFQNAAGNYWYRVTLDSGETAYLYGGHSQFTESVSSDLTLTGAGLPGTLTQGDSFAVSGKVTSGRNQLVQVRVGVYSGSGLLGFQVTGSTVAADSNACNLSSAAPDFASLDIGSYTYCVIADFKGYYATSAQEMEEYSGSVTLKSAAFTVEANTAYLNQCTFYPAYCEIRTTTATALNNLPCTAGTNSSIQQQTTNADVTLTAIGLYVNTSGDIWYMVPGSANEPLFLYAGHTTYVQTLTTDISLTDSSLPGDMTVGSTFDITGTLNAQYNQLGSISVKVHTGGTTSGAVVTGNTAAVSGNAYTLTGSTLTSAIRFDTLPAGTYLYEISCDYTSYYADTARTLSIHQGTALLGQSSFLMVQCDHSFTSSLVQSATCTEPGILERVCSKCGQVNRSTILATGHKYSSVTTQPTCTQNGSTSYTCTTCGHSYSDQMVPMLGHQYTSVYTAPTCVTAGRFIYTCQTCGDSFEEPISATGHSYSHQVIAPGCETSGYTLHTCTGCGDSYSDNLTPAVGHSYSMAPVDATCTQPGGNCFTCQTCGDSFMEGLIPATGHSFESGSCTACGAADPDYVPPVTQPTLTLKYPTLEFKDIIRINVYYTAENTRDVVGMGLITYKSKVPVWNVENAEAVIPGYEVAGSLCFVRTQGIEAKCLGDTYYFSVYAQLTDGSYVYTPLVGYSAKSYATSKLNGSDAGAKPLAVAMLNYGAAAQEFFGYNTDSLANAGLTAQQQALVEPYRKDMLLSTTTTVASAKEGAFTKKGGFTSRYPTISFGGAFCINYYCIPEYQPASVVRMYYWNQEDFNAATVLTGANATGIFIMSNTGSGSYHALVEDIAAKDLDQGIYVAFAYSDGTITWTSGVIGYSIGVYCNSQASKTDTFGDLAKATAVYGYYAKQAFYQ